jgi:cell division control protein 6
MISKYLHLSFTLKTLTDEERKILKALALASLNEKEMNAGDVHKTISQSVEIGYTRFYEVIKKLDALRLINLHYREGKGRTRVISLRYDPQKVLEYLS